MRYDAAPPSIGGCNMGRNVHMQRIVLASATILTLALPTMLASTPPAMSQSLGQSVGGPSGPPEGMVIERLTRPGNRTVFATRLATDTQPCPTIEGRETTPLRAPRLGRTVLAEALVYTDTIVGYVYLLAYANGPHEVYFSSYTKNNCRLEEAQSHGRVFVGDDHFKQARLYYHSLFNELTE